MSSLFLLGTRQMKKLSLVGISSWPSCVHPQLLKDRPPALPYGVSPPLGPWELGQGSPSSFHFPRPGMLYTQLHFLNIFTPD